MSSSSIHHYIIWSGKCYLLVHTIVESIFWKSRWFVAESISHLIILSLVYWWTLVSELTSIDINWIHDEKYHPCPWWFVLSSIILLPSIQHQIVRVLCYTLRSLLSSICSSLPWNITTFYVKNVVVILLPLENSWYKWYFTITILFLVPVLFLTGIPTDGLVILKLLATLLLWS